jgi:hypothetical protein
MNNLLNKILHREKRLTDEQLAILQINEGLKILENHMVAIARLHFIKPETLVREVNNMKANMDYLQSLIRERNNGEN